jgi:transposase
MPTALSLDLRVRVLAAVARGLSHRGAGERFGVSASSVSRWRALEREQGEARARSVGGDRKSGRIDAHKERILARLEATPDLAIEELRRALADEGLVVGYDTIRRFFRPPRHHAQKKTAHASEQDRPDILRRRRAWFEGQADLCPEHLVFIDETWASTNMARVHGRCQRGQRLRVGRPHGHWKTTTFIAGLTKTMTARPRRQLSEQ